MLWRMYHDGKVEKYQNSIAKICIRLFLLSFRCFFLFLQRALTKIIVLHSYIRLHYALQLKACRQVPCAHQTQPEKHKFSCVAEPCSWDIVESQVNTVLWAKNNTEEEVWSVLASYEKKCIQVNNIQSKTKNNV